MAIQQLDTVTQQNAAASEEMASTSEELSVQAADLADTSAGLAAEAQQLQQTIAYSRLDEGRSERGLDTRPAAGPRLAPGKPEPRLSRPVGTSAAKPAARSPRPTAKPAAGAKPPAKPNRKNGVAIDMTVPGGDQEDADFKAF